MAEFAYPAFNIAEYSLIMHVLLQPKRLSESGFKQSVVLANEVSMRFHIPLDFMTHKRHDYTERQIGRGKKEWETNVRGFFPLQTQVKLRDKRSSSWMTCVHPAAQ